MNDNYEKQAILGIGLKIFRFLDGNQRLNETITSLQETVRANQASITDCVAGLRVFGIDINADGAWVRFVEQYAQEINALMSETEQQPRNEQPIANATSQTFIVAKQPISVLLLDRLKDVGFHGSKALPLRDHLKQHYNIDTHYKTVGMSLYRLSQESPPKVHRKGHTWFFGPPVAETKNPGGDTPGQLNVPE